MIITHFSIYKLLQLFDTLDVALSWSLLKIIELYQMLAQSLFLVQKR